MPQASSLPASQKAPSPHSITPSTRRPSLVRGQACHPVGKPATCTTKNGRQAWGQDSVPCSQKPCTKSSSQGGPPPRYSAEQTTSLCDELCMARRRNGLARFPIDPSAGTKCSAPLRIRMLTHRPQNSRGSGHSSAIAPCRPVHKQCALRRRTGAKAPGSTPRTMGYNWYCYYYCYFIRDYFYFTII